MESDEIGLEQAYGVETPDDNRRLYAKWAATYEARFVDARRYRYPRAIAELFDTVVPTHGIAEVADIGTGTGLVGLYLTALRPHLVVDGFDIAPEMLAMAAPKRRSAGTPCYRSLYERDLTQAVLDTNAPFDAVISAGTFTHGHLGPEALSNIVPLARPGGHFVIGANAEHFEMKQFDRHLQQLVDGGAISAPTYERIQVYEVGSPHFGDQAVVSLFQRV